VLKFSSLKCLDYYNKIYHIGIKKTHMPLMRRERMGLKGMGVEIGFPGLYLAPFSTPLAAYEIIGAKFYHTILFRSPNG
jgi:hypothetical protein